MNETVATRTLRALIRAYQLVLAPVMGGQCRFYPTCSEYARQAVSRHGAVYGSCLASWRLLRCQPLCRGGIDEVPPKRNKAS